MKLLLTSILLCFTIHLLLSQSFTNNIWPCSHSNQDCHSDLSAYDEYKAIQQLNNQNLETQLLKRNDFTHKLDSAYSWNFENNVEFIVLKSEFFFDEDQNSELVLNYSNDLVNNKWIPSRFNLSTYNKENLLIKKTFNIWDGSMSNFNHNNPYILNEYEYYNDGRLAVSEGSNQSDIIKNRATNRFVYQYDSLGNVTNRSAYFWIDNIDTMVHSKETTYNYNAFNQLESIVILDFNLERGWEYDDSTYLHYNELEFLEKELSYNYTYTSSALDSMGFIPSTENYYFYNEDNQLIARHFYDLFIVESQTFFIENFFEYEYHDYGSLKSEVFFVTFNYGIKEVISETFYTHNLDALTENTLRPRRGPLNDTHLHNEKFVLFQEEKFKKNSNDFRVLDYRTQAFFSEIDPVSTTNPVISDSNYLKVSPNPTSDFIYFDWTDYSGELDITLYNITGQKVRSQRSNNNSAVDLTTLDNGVYLYTVLAGDRVVSGRVVKM